MFRVRGCHDGVARGDVAFGGLVGMRAREILRERRLLEGLYLRFGIQGLEFRVWGSGLRVEGLRFRVTVQGSWFSNQSVGCRVQGLWCRV